MLQGNYKERHSGFQYPLTQKMSKNAKFLKTYLNFDCIFYRSSFYFDKWNSVTAKFNALLYQTIMSDEDSYHTDLKYVDFKNVEKCLILSIFPDDLSLRFFFKNRAVSLSSLYCSLTSCKISEKSYERIRRYTKTDGRTDGQGRLLRTPSG